MFIFSDLENIDEGSNTSLLESFIRVMKKSYCPAMSEPTSLRSSVRYWVKDVPASLLTHGASPTSPSRTSEEPEREASPPTAHTGIPVCLGSASSKPGEDHWTGSIQAVNSRIHILISQRGVPRSPPPFSVIPPMYYDTFLGPCVFLSYLDVEWYR